MIEIIKLFVKDNMFYLMAIIIASIIYTNHGADIIKLVNIEFTKRKLILTRLALVVLLFFTAFIANYCKNQDRVKVKEPFSIQIGTYNLDNNNEKQESRISGLLYEQLSRNFDKSKQNKVSVHAFKDIFPIYDKERQTEIIYGIKKRRNIKDGIFIYGIYNKDQIFQKIHLLQSEKLDPAKEAFTIYNPDPNKYDIQIASKNIVAFAIALTNYYINDYAEAIKAFKDVDTTFIGKENDKLLKPIYFIFLGNAYLRNKDLGKGLECYKKAQKTNNNELNELIKKNLKSVNSYSKKMTVYGCVVTIQNSIPIAGAEVCVRGLKSEIEETVITNEKGYFEIVIDSVPYYRLDIKAKGYEDFNDSKFEFIKEYDLGPIPLRNERNY